MIEQQITLCSNGRAVLSGYSGGLLLGYAHNTGVYRLRVVCSGEWDGTTVVAFWHLPGPAEPLTTLVADGAVEVPALVTAQGGSGTVTFEGSDGTRTVTSASVPYRVLSNSGTTDPTLPEPGTPAWQQFLQQVKQELRNAASGLSDEERGHILALFRHAVYDNGEMLPHYNALAALWSGSSLPDVPPTPSQPDPPNNGLPTPRYKLAAPKTFVPANKEWIDKDLEANMDHLLNVVVMGRACRNTANIKNRQPIGRMFVKAPFELSEFYREIVEDELNVKEAVFTDDVREFTTYTFKPQMRTVGPRYGKLLGQIKQALSELDGNAAMDELRTKGVLTMSLAGTEVSLTEEDLLIDMVRKEGYVTEADKEVTVVLDTNLTPELLEEGFVREIISKVQTMRKEAGFEVMDHINLYQDENDAIAEILKKHTDEIKSEVLAEEIFIGKITGYEKDWNINGEHVMLGVEKVTV